MATLKYLLATFIRSRSKAGEQAGVAAASIKTFKLEFSNFYKDVYINIWNSLLVPSPFLLDFTLHEIKGDHKLFPVSSPWKVLLLRKYKISRIM